jgi:hypothetical protein
MSILKALDRTTSKAVSSSENYVKTSRRYFQLKIFQQLSLFSSYMLKIALLGSFAALGLIFIAISAAFALANYFDSLTLGYLCVGLCFFLLVTIIFLSRRAIDKMIIKKLSKSFFDL